MYFSYDYKTYYVTLFRYDFTQISFQEFVRNPDLNRAQFALVPLHDIENIYDNISYSLNRATQTGGKTAYTYQVAIGLQRLQDQPCAVTTNVPGQLCQGSGQDKHEYGEACSMSSDKRATPGYTIIDTRPCYGPPGSSAPGGHEGGGGGGGGGNTPTNPNPNPNPNPQPIKSYPVGGFRGFLNKIKIQITIGNTNKNLDVLKGIVENNLSTIQDLYSKASDTQEHGYMFTKQKKNGKYTPLANQVPLPLNNGSNWALNVDDYIKIAINTGILHVHTNKNTIIHDASNRETKANPMFSHSDLQTIFRIGKVNSMSNKKELYDLFVGLITSNNLYVVMFPSGTTKIDFQTVSNGTPFSHYINDNEFWEKVRDELGKKYKSIASIGIVPLSPEQEAAMYEKALLEVLKDNNIPLNLYRLDANNGLFNGSWKLLGLDASGNVTENQGY